MQIELVNIVKIPVRLQKQLQLLTKLLPKSFTVCLRVCCLKNTTCAVYSTTTTWISSSTTTTASSSDGVNSSTSPSSTSDENTAASTIASSSGAMTSTTVSSSTSAERTAASTIASSSSAMTSTTVSSSTSAERAEAVHQKSSTLVAVVASCLVVLLVVVIAVVVGLFFWRRRQQPGGITSCDSALVNLPAANPENGQDSLHAYDRLSRQNQKPYRGNIHSGPETAPDNKDENEYIDLDDNPTTSVYNKLGEDRQQTMTTASNPKQTKSSVGAMVTSPSKEASAYTLAQVVDNEFSDKQPPEYFVLEQEGDMESVASTEPEQYFVLEDAIEAGKQDSAPATQTQQPSLSERLQHDSAKQRVSSASFPDYFVLEEGGDDHQGAAAASDRATFTDGVDLFRQEGAEYSKPPGLRVHSLASQCTLTSDRE